eukprot:SAG31_NODE_3847_length_3819_cov_1.762366_1_plen_266_part_00
MQLVGAAAGNVSARTPRSGQIAIVSVSRQPDCAAAFYHIQARDCGGRSGSSDHSDRSGLQCLRRYSDFDNLRKQLLMAWLKDTRYRRLRMLGFPTKWSGILYDEETLLTKRRLLLEHWLNFLLEHLDGGCDPFVVAFLAPLTLASPAAAASLHLPVARLEPGGRGNSCGTVDISAVESLGFDDPDEDELFGDTLSWEPDVDNFVLSETEKARYDPSWSSPLVLSLVLIYLNLVRVIHLSQIGRLSSSNWPSLTVSTGDGKASKHQ